ncbi:MAG TPA: hypothetical protein VGJ90_06475 [Methylophilaceae bacterium]|jgi:hypothetical protein
MKKPYYIDFPQEHVEGQAHTYRCIYCKVVTTKINGSLQGHLPTCEYRLKLEREGFEKNPNSTSASYSIADDFD